MYRRFVPYLKQAVRHGALIIYETFTLAQREFGRPVNPDFLLQPDELAHCFNDWLGLHNYEGELTYPQRGVAHLISRKPT